MKKLVLLFSIIFFSGLLLAQNTPVDQLFDKYTLHSIPERLKEHLPDKMKKTKQK